MKALLLEAPLWAKETARWVALPFLLLFSMAVILGLWAIDSYWTLMDNPWSAGLLMGVAFCVGYYFNTQFHWML